MDVAADDLRKAADIGALVGLPGQQRGLRVGLVEILQNGEALCEYLAVLEEGGHQPLRVQRHVLRHAMLHAGQADEARLPVDPLDFQRDAKAIRGRRPEEV